MAFMVALLASSRGRSGLGWFCLAFLASPIGAGLLLLTRPNLKADAAALREIADSKVCPRCAETVRSAAFVCRFCGHEFDMSQGDGRYRTPPAESPYIEDISLPF
jgi:rubredoxin